ncbi:MAG: shikimate kinase [Ignavibacteriaceae bacterium]
MNNNIVYLAGFMGAGKSTVGPILANTLGWNYYDLDKVIEERLGKKIKTIFEEKGEPFFRNAESEILRELSHSKNVIISLGGGTIVNQNNLKIIKSTGKIIYLKASIDSIYKRVAFKRDRPNLIIDGEEFSKEKLIQKINNLFNAREKYYNQADLTIDTDNISIGVTVDKLAKIINDEFEINKGV